jgi:hypothetical protein
MEERRTLWDRIRAWLDFEAPASLLEAYRRARPSVVEALDLAQARWLGCTIDGLSPWTMPPAARAELLCAWNAFALQTLGDAILDADYEANPATRGFVSPLSARQAQGFYAGVEGWLTRARQARADPGFLLEVPVPAQLPEWVDSTLEPLPAPLVQGLLRAMRSLEEQLAAVITLLPRAGRPSWEAQLERVLQRYGSARSKARRAMVVHRTASARELDPELLPCARGAIEIFYELGQLIAGEPDGAAPVPASSGRTLR